MRNQREKQDLTICVHDHTSDFSLDQKKEKLFVIKLIIITKKQIYFVLRECYSSLLAITVNKEKRKRSIYKTPYEIGVYLGLSSQPGPGPVLLSLI